MRTACPTVEDISTDAMAAGIDWTWETFPEYMAAVERRPKAMNYAMYIGHSAMRMYVMGQRAVTDKASDEEIGSMARIVQEGLRPVPWASPPRAAHTHLTPDGTPVASRIAAWEEIERIVAAMAGTRCRHLPDRARDLSSTDNDRAFLTRMRHIALAYKRARSCSADLHSAGRRPARPGGPRSKPSRTPTPRAAACSARRDALDQRHLLAEVLPALRRAAGLEEHPFTAADEAANSGCAIRRCAAN